MNVHLPCFAGSLNLVIDKIAGHSDRVTLRQQAPAWTGDPKVELSAADVDALIHVLQAMRGKMT